MTSYSVRNQPAVAVAVGDGEPGRAGTSPMERERAPAGTAGKAGRLSEMLRNVRGGVDGGANLVSVALKSLPVEPGRWQSGGGFAREGSRKGPETCKEAVEEMVMELKGVCEEAGAAGPVDDEGFITEEDIVR